MTSQSYEFDYFVIAALNSTVKFFLTYILIELLYVTFSSQLFNFKNFLLYPYKQISTVDMKREISFYSKVISICYNVKIASILTVETF